MSHDNALEREEHRQRRTEDASVQQRAAHAKETTTHLHTLLGGQALNSRGNSQVRASAMQRSQQIHGNRAVQRLVQRGNVPNSVQAGEEQAEMPVQREGEGGHHHEAGWLDKLFGLNPDRSFVRAGLEGLLGPESPAHVQEGDSDWTKLGRAGYSAMAGMAAPFAIAGGEILDKINHPTEWLLGPFAGPH